MRVHDEPQWLVFFGGARRHRTVLALKDSGRRIAAVAVPERQSPVLTNSIQKLADAGLRIYTVDRRNYDEISRRFSDCNLLSIGFPYLLAGECLARHPIAINVHPTLLPAYRGPTSGAYILINAERETGATVHIMEEGADRGNILSQVRVELSPFDTLRSMQRKTYAAEGEALIAAAELLAEGGRGEAQNEAAASEFHALRKPEDSQLDANRPLADLVDEIRACDPDDFPAFFFHHGEKLCIRLWRPEKPEDEEDLL
jgi:methionyl-tRNA formyltransferase